MVTASATFTTGDTLKSNAFLPPVDKRTHAELERQALHELVRLGATGPVSGGTGKALPVEKDTLHGACHTFCVDAFKRNVDPVLVANNRGHATTQMVLTLYRKFRPALTDPVRADRRSHAR